MPDTYDMHSDAQGQPMHGFTTEAWMRNPNSYHPRTGRPKGTTARYMQPVPKHQRTKQHGYNGPEPGHIQDWMIREDGPMTKDNYWKPNKKGNYFAVVKGEIDR